MSSIDSGTLPNEQLAVDTVSFEGAFTTGTAVVDNSDENLIMAQRSAQFSVVVDYIKIQSDAAFTDSYDPADFYEYGDRDTAFTDTDGDGLSDADEVAAGSNPALADSDGDGIGDYEEINYYHSNPNSADTDGDGISDYLELTYYHTSLLLTDTNGDGRLDGVPDYDYGYDLNGNRISKVTVSATHNYVYDRENRLVSVNDESASTLFTAVYDYRTRRMEKTENSNTVKLVYDGGVNVQERDSTGSLTKQLVRGTGLGGGIGSVLYSETTSTEYFCYNAIGSTVALTDATGLVTSTTDYEAFGKEVASSGSSDNNRKFCTKERDESIGLDNFGFRYFDWELGRFITRDPSGYPDGANNYLYCHNNPINFIDPLGLESSMWDDIKTAWSNPIEMSKNGFEYTARTYKNLAVGAGKAVYGATVGLGEQISLTGVDAVNAIGGENDNFKSAIYKGAVGMGSEGKGTLAIIGEGVLQGSGVRYGESLSESGIKAFETGNFDEFQQNMGGAAAMAGMGAVSVKAARMAKAKSSAKVDAKNGSKVKTQTNVQKVKNGDKLQGFQEHHIISDKNLLTKNHELVEMAGGNDILQKRTNKIYLPEEAANHPTRSIHKGRHLNSVSENIAQKMDAKLEKIRQMGDGKTSAQKALKQIQAQERKVLKTGNRKLNKNHREWAE